MTGISRDEGGTALVLPGGGARAAYQVGLLRWMARNVPGFRPSILCGVSAGAINAAFLAANEGTLEERCDSLTHLWSYLSTRDVFESSLLGSFGTALRTGLAAFSGGLLKGQTARGFVDTRPLSRLLRRVLHASLDGELPGIARNLERGDLRAVAITTSSYTTGQSVTWVQGRGVTTWERPNRVSVGAHLRVDHVMASSALPFVFPAAGIGKHWYGDGGIRLAAPLSPAVHLGADRIIAVSTRHDRTRAEAERPSIVGYPPPAQVAGVLLNSVFLDLIDQDALRLERFNELIEAAPSHARGGMRKIDLLVVRPSRDLGALANEYEAALPRGFRFLSRGWGTRETRSNDLLSMLMFQPDYLTRLIEMGEQDAEARRAEILSFVAPHLPAAGVTPR